MGQILDIHRLLRAWIFRLQSAYENSWTNATENSGCIVHLPGSPHLC